MVTSGDKGVVRSGSWSQSMTKEVTTSGSSHMMTKKTLIWVLMCKEKRMKNRGKSDLCHIPEMDPGFLRHCTPSAQSVPKEPSLAMDQEQAGHFRNPEVVGQSGPSLGPHRPQLSVPHGNQCLKLCIWHCPLAEAIGWMTPPDWLHVEVNESSRVELWDTR